MLILVYDRLLKIFPNIFLVQCHFIVYPVGVWEPTERLSPVFPALPERSAGGRGRARPVTTVQHLPALPHTRTETASAAGAAAASAAAAAATALSGVEKLCK
jgi:hypothetical protein